MRGTNEAEDGPKPVKIQRGAHNEQIKPGLSDSWQVLLVFNVKTLKRDKKAAGAAASPVQPVNNSHAAEAAREERW